MKLLSMYNRYNVSVMVLVFILSSTSSFFLIKEVLKNEVDGSLIRVKDKIQRFVDQNGRLPEVNLLNDEMISFLKKTEGSELSKAKLEFRSVRVFVPGLGREHFCRQLNYPVLVKGQWYLVSITNPLEGTSHLTKLLLSVTVITIFMLIVATFIINRIVISKLWRPFYQTITEVSNFRINSSQLPHFPVTKVEEFNFMIESLRTATSNATENYRILKEFTENAAHEIQTPLAIIQSKLDLLVQQNIPQIDVDSLRSAYGAIRKLSKINQDLLLLTKIENSQFEKKEQINVKVLITEKITEFKEIWQLKEIEIHTEMEDAVLSMNPELLEILVYNVLGNATKHNRNEGFISICLFRNELVVANSGIDRSLDQERLFSRFYKETNSIENNGLGLSIIKQICETSDITPGYRYENGSHQFYFLFKSTLS